MYSTLLYIHSDNYDHIYIVKNLYDHVPYLYIFPKEDLSHYKDYHDSIQSL